MTKAGIIGCGNISRIYAKNGPKTGEIDWVACADLDPTAAKKLAKEFAIPKALSVDDLLNHDGIDIVLNLTIPAAHADIAIAALHAGKSVYIEKPLALRRKQAREMIGLAQEKKLRLGCAPDTFLGGGFQTVRKLIDDGAVGRVIGGTAFMMSRGPENWHPNPEFFYKKGAGPLFDMGPYYITALTTILGPVVRVNATAKASFETRTISSKPLAGQKIAVDTPTHVNAILEFENGAVVTLITSFDIAAHNLPCMELYGEEGSLALPDPNTFGGPVRLAKRGGKGFEDQEIVFANTENSRAIGLADMANAIQTKRPHRANDAVAYHTLDVMHAILDSSDLGKHVEIRSSMMRPAPLRPGAPDWAVAV